MDQALFLYRLNLSRVYTSFVYLVFTLHVPVDPCHPAQLQSRYDTVMDGCFNGWSQAILSPFIKNIVSNEAGEHHLCQKPGLDPYDEM